MCDLKNKTLNIRNKKFKNFNRTIILGPREYQILTSHYSHSLNVGVKGRFEFS